MFNGQGTTGKPVESQRQTRLRWENVGLKHGIWGVWWWVMWNVVFVSKGPVRGLWFFMAIEESTYHGRVQQLWRKYDRLTCCSASKGVSKRWLCSAWLIHYHVSNLTAHWATTRHGHDVCFWHFLTKQGNKPISCRYISMACLAAPLSHLSLNMIEMEKTTR